MKTIMKIAALAVITVLAAISCAPEVTLTSADWSEYDSQRGAVITSNNNSSSVTPVVALVQGSALPLPGTTGLTDEDRELTLTFPADADFLKASNDQLLAKLQEFLSFFVYTNPEVTSPAPAEQTIFSAKGADVTYEFVRRQNSGNTVYPDITAADTAIITIRLTSLSALPGSQPATGPTTGMAYKIDGAKYTVGGYGLDVDNDGNAGEAVYDDYYDDVAVTGHTDTFIPPGGMKNFELTIGNIGNGSKTSFSPSAASMVFTIASITGYGLGDGSSATPAADTDNLRRKAVLEALIPLFKVQKFDATSRTWVDFAGATISYQNDPAPTAPISGTYGELYTIFSVEDLGIYRVYASGLKGLKTSGQAGFYGVEQKISIQNGAFGDLRTDWYASARTGYYNQDTHTFMDTLAITADSSRFDYNNAGKKATVVFDFPMDTHSSGGNSVNSYVKEDVEMFKKFARFGFAPPNVSLFETAFIKFTDVKFERTFDNQTPPVQDGTRVILTLDEGASIFGNETTTAASLYLAPGFEYTHNTCTFGDFTAIDTIIDGIIGWKAYTVQ